MALQPRFILSLLAAGFTGLPAFAIAAAPAVPPVYTEDFETGALDFTFSGLWHVTTNYPAGGTKALAFCQGETPGSPTPDGNYDLGAILDQFCFSGPIGLPAGEWDLVFDAFNGDEFNNSPGSFDRLSVGVSLDGVTVDRIVASSAPQNGGTNIPEWDGSPRYFHVTANLSDYAGQTIYLVFEYATIDAIDNGHPGARLDNLAIQPGRPRPLAVDDQATTNGTPVVIPVLANDSDPNGLSLSFHAFTPASFGKVSDNGDGTLTYTPGPGYDGRDSFQYNITNGDKLSFNATVRVRNSSPLYKDLAVIHQPVPGQAPGTNYAGIGALPDESDGDFPGKYKGPAGTRGAIFGLDGAVVQDTTLIPIGGDGAHIGTFYAPSGGAGRAKLKTGTGLPAVTGANDAVVLADLHATPRVIARESAAAPGTNGLTFKTFTSVARADSFSPPQGTFQGGQASGVAIPNSTTYFTAKLNAAAHGKDFGLWGCQAGGSPELIARTGDPFNGRTIKTITALKGGSGSAAENRATDGNGACLARLAFTDKTQVIGEFQFTSFTAFAATGDASPIADVTYLSFGIPAVGHNTVTFSARLAGTGVSGANNAAVVVNGAIAARKSQPVPGLTGLVFASFKDPVAGTSATPDGDAVFSAKVAGPGVSKANNTVLCHWVSSTLTPLARTGDAAPGTTGTFDTFTSLAYGSDTNSGPLFVAKLTSGGAISHANQTGLWSASSAGTVNLLARNGDAIPSFGQLRTLKSLGALKAAGGSTGNGRGYDDGSHAFLVGTFADGTKSLIQITTP